MCLGDLFLEGVEEEGYPNLSINLLTVASTGNAAFLDELLKAGLDPDVGDSKGRTPLVSSSVLVRYTCEKLCSQFEIFMTIIDFNQFLFNNLKNCRASVFLLEIDIPIGISK